MRHNAWIGLIVLGFIPTSGCVRLIDDPAYVHDTEKLHDEARVVPHSEFQDHRLHGLLTGFAAAHCGKNTAIARLTVSPSAWDLMTGSNFHVPKIQGSILYFEPRAFDFRFSKEPVVAQALCVNGAGIALVRRGQEIRSFAINNRKMPETREIDADGKLRISLSGLSIDTPREGTRPVIRIFGRVADLANEVVAQEAHDYLERLVDERLVLILRTDSFFAEYGGPLWDVFDRDLPSGTSAQYQDRRHVVCPPLDTNGRCMSIERPTGLPYERWGRF